MKLSEDVAKRLLRSRGLPAPEGATADDPDTAAALAERMGGAAVLKALVLAGRRGKQGLVRVARSPNEARSAAAAMLATEFGGAAVSRLYVEPVVEIADELYLSFAFGDRAPRMVLSRHGGVEIEATFESEPEAVRVVEIDPLRGVKPWDAVEEWRRAGVEGRPLAALGALTARLYDAFVALDATMLELNPVALDRAGKPSLVGVMMEIDDFALDRQGLRSPLGAPVAGNPREAAVETANRSYPGGDSRYSELDGDIGLLVAGGGAGLLQHDLIRSMGGRPANHSDVSPAPGTEKLEAVFDAIFTNPRSRSLLVGYNYLQMARCDFVARALKLSVERNRIDARAFPIVLRLVGPAEAEARAIVAGIPGAEYLPSDASLEDGCRAIVAATERARLAREAAE